MGTELPDVNGNILSVFYSEKEILGPYRRAGIVHFADCSARGAGKLFREGGKLIRVAQDCTGGYGRGLVFSEVVPAPCDPDVNFKEIFRFYPPRAVGRGIHTYNRLGGGAIVDRKRFRHPLLGRLAESLRKIVVFFQSKELP